MKRLIPAVIAASAIVLTGCSAGPSQDEIVERFAIEFAATVGGDPADPIIQEFAGELAEGASEDCVSDTYWRVMRLQEEGPEDEFFGMSVKEVLLRTWAVSCLVLFEKDLSESLRTDYKEILIQSMSPR